MQARPPVPSATPSRGAFPNLPTMPGITPERRSPPAAVVLLLSTTFAVCVGPEGEAADVGNGSAVSGTAPAAARGVPSVVLLRPADLPTATAPATDTHVMDQASMTFRATSTRA